MFYAYNLQINNVYNSVVARCEHKYIHEYDIECNLLTYTFMYNVSTYIPMSSTTSLACQGGTNEPFRRTWIPVTQSLVLLYFHRVHVWLWCCLFFQRIIVFDCNLDIFSFFLSPVRTILNSRIYIYRNI